MRRRDLIIAIGGSGMSASTEGIEVVLISAEL